ncbi:26S proteasome non-ATPase regulatory subunit 2-like [Notechis scutatus]|uniref:26S proteasome non-ATPase regulatory subunit 2-like n=1 Tax=Notechis scutatus TaxID=8663 RepID=A0A6J1W0N2_9SAUR|nr:26S proteasome non-ATPase regulatory subunit 2-like [Notechis scutatus]XP_026548829.1 26S proteasome non-ATPase regulatory subunit 2-like [Notechis scutatus]XP_026548830.1 26S proteasome non-ATPase regulatory subunit 2-like [Notechis scutatus]XP_026548831.1 26S proteasome non-ATPase regulatory subunit 2-like [Notechis scutatus]
MEQLPDPSGLFLKQLCLFLVNISLSAGPIAKEQDTALYRPALEELRRQIRSSTTSMTSVPKPLKFLRPHYGKLKEIYENMAVGENKRFAADIISVLAMTMSGERECLKYRLVGSQEPLASWGHEYVR